MNVTGTEVSVESSAAGNCQPRAALATQLASSVSVVGLGIATALVTVPEGAMRSLS